MATESHLRILPGDIDRFPGNEEIAGPSKRLDLFLRTAAVATKKDLLTSAMRTAKTFSRDTRPEYSVKEISKSGKPPYWRMASFIPRPQTQAKSFLDKVSQMGRGANRKAGHSDSLLDGGRIRAGKSLVGGSYGDI